MVFALCHATDSTLTPPRIEHLSNNLNPIRLYELHLFDYQSQTVNLVGWRLSLVHCACRLVFRATDRPLRWILRGTSRKSGNDKIPLPPPFISEISITGTA